MTGDDAAVVAADPIVAARYAQYGGGIRRYARVARARAAVSARQTDGRPIPHYARYHPKIVDQIITFLRVYQPVGAQGRQKILDPMAGTGERLRRLERSANGGHEVWGLEIEREWVEGYPHPRLIHGDARHLPWPDNTFDAIICSPPYGNRDSDRTGAWWDNADRRTYAAALGRNVSDRSLCVPWGDVYKKGMGRIWAESVRVLRPTGLLILVTKNFVRTGQTIDVTGWHSDVVTGLFYMSYVTSAVVATPGRMSGQNHEIRAVSGETVTVFVPSARSKYAAIDSRHLLDPDTDLD